MNISILTPTYNRADLLKRLYKALLTQTDKDFVWIIVDDGSTDNTEETVRRWIASESEFEIRYLKKINSGKSSALNLAFESCRDIDFFAVIDSDDIAIPQAVETIKNKAKQYSANEIVGAIFFRYQNVDNSLLCLSKKSILTEEKILTRYEHDAKYTKDDGCFGYYKRVTDNYRYPEYPNEKYVGPTVLQMAMARQYKIAFTEDVVGIAEYQDGGLTRSGRKLRIKNPLGMIHYSGLLQDKINPSLKSRIKYAISAQAYASLCPYTKKQLFEMGIPKSYLKFWAKPFGMLLALRWKSIYGPL